MIERSHLRLAQYGWDNVDFKIEQNGHMLYFTWTLRGSLGPHNQINCHNEDEASMIYKAVAATPILVKHLSFN